MLHFIALVPPLTAEVEHAFSLMNLISTPLRSLTSDHISHCKRISKYGEFNKNDYDTILKKWLGADNTKSKTQNFSCLFEKKLNNTEVFYNLSHSCHSMKHVNHSAPWK